MAKSTFFKTCPHCGARLDPGERCDCRKAKAEARPEKTINKSDRRKIS